MDYGCGDQFSRISRDFVSPADSSAPPAKKQKRSDGAGASAQQGLRNGTAEYASLHAHQGGTQSFRDDLEAVGYEQRARTDNGEGGALGSASQS